MQLSVARRYSKRGGTGVASTGRRMEKLKLGQIALLGCPNEQWPLISEQGQHKHQEQATIVPNEAIDCVCLSREREYVRVDSIRFDSTRHRIHTMGDCGDLLGL